MVENNQTDLDDILKDRIAALKLDRDQAKGALARIKLRPKLQSFDAQTMESFGQIMRDLPLNFHPAAIRVSDQTTTP
jgi:site-specific DNA recombinase